MPTDTDAPKITAPLNRILIRMKVVQMLYAYLLTKADFQLPPAPDANASPDRKYAYGLFMDLMLLMAQISQYPVRRGDKPAPQADAPLALRRGRVVPALMSDHSIKDYLLRQGPLGATESKTLDSLAPLVPELSEEVASSAAFKDYQRRRNPELREEAQMWKAVMRTIVAKDPKVLEALRANPAFTNVGMLGAFDLLDQTLEGYTDARYDLRQARSDLDRSLEKAYELYASLLGLIPELTNLQRQRLEDAKHKHLPTPEDINPNLKFVENALAHRLQEDEKLQQYLSDGKISWTDDDPLFLRRLLDLVVQSPQYSTYMEAPRLKEGSAEAVKSDYEFWRTIMAEVILPSQELTEALESKSIFWNDDMSVVGTFVVKTIRRMATNPGATLMPHYADQEAQAFGPDLFMQVVDGFQTYRGYIDRFIDARQWDTERLAFMDIVIMATAIAEMLNYPLIPLAVTMNEYVELAKEYSTERSGQFVNGTLFSVAKYLHSEGLLDKPVETTKPGKA